MKYLYYAKKMGTKIAIVNPMREPGLARYWVPSVPDSAVWGTRFADEFFAVHTGGDIAFINGVLKHLIDNRWIDEPFIENIRRASTTCGSSSRRCPGRSSSGSPG